MLVTVFIFILFLLEVFASKEASERQKQLVSETSNQSESSSMNLTSIGSPTIGTLIGKAIGNSTSSDDVARVAEKSNELALRPNQSDSVHPD
jgi:hypothetical protein